MKHAFLLLAALLAVPAAAQQKDEQAVAQAVESLRTAMIKGEKAPLEAIAAPELSYGHSGGLVEDKATFVENLTNGNSVFKRIDLSDQSVKLVGTDVAIVRHQLVAETANKGQAGTVKLAILLVWKKINRQWLLIARQAVKVP